MVRAYQIFKEDIEPKGFQVIRMGEYLTSETVTHAQLTMQNSAVAEQMTDQNYLLGRIHYSYGVLRTRLQLLLEQYRARIGLNTKWSGPIGLSGIFSSKR